MNTLFHIVLLAAVSLVGVNAVGPNLRSQLAQSPRNLEAMEYMAAMTGTRPGCYLEHNYDYVANDVANAPGQATDCCLLCLRQTGCHAFSWTDHNGGTCWLKSGRGKVVWKENAISSVVINVGQAVCVQEAGIDYVGNDIGSVAGASADKCCAACEAFKNCRAFSWSNHNGGTCWLKSTVNRKIVSSGVTSAEPFGTFNVMANCGLEQGVDFVGNDIGNVAASKPEDCCAKCMDTKGCRAFSWTNQNGGTCWLKNLKGDTVANANVVSAVVFSNPPAPVCALEVGVDYVDNDMGNAPSKDAYGCCSICLQKDGCKAFSWSDHNGGTCWLKSAKGATIAKAGVKSAIVVV